MLNISLNSKEFVNAINLVKNFVGGKEERRKVLHCVHFDFSVKGELRVVASNGHSLAMQHLEVDSTFRESFSVPVEALKGLIPGLKTAKEASLKFDGNQLEINSTPVDLYTGMKFPDYKRVLPDLPVQGVLNVGPVREGVKHLKTQGSKKGQQQHIALTFNGRNLTVWKGEWGSTAFGGFIFANSGESFTTPFTTVDKIMRVMDISYVLAALKPFKGEVKLKLSAIDPNDDKGTTSMLILEKDAVTVCTMPVNASYYKVAYENFLRTVQ